MAGTTTIVTDSTACLPPEVADRQHVVVVPLRVVLAGEVHDESNGLLAGVSAFWRPGAMPTTSRPAPARFAEA
jgi:fatty acid kinase fatty acid binding subunit